MSSTEYYLTVHFAPSTECVTTSITVDQFESLKEAMHKHVGEIVLEVSSTNKTLLNVVRNINLETPHYYTKDGHIVFGNRGPDPTDV